MIKSDSARRLAIVILATLAGFGYGYTFVFDDPEHGGPFWRLDLYKRHCLSAIQFAVVAAVVSIIAVSRLYPGGKESRNWKWQFSLAALLQLMVLAGLLAFCIRGYLTIRNSS